MDQVPHRRFVELDPSRFLLEGEKEGWRTVLRDILVYSDIIICMCACTEVS